MKEKTNSQGDWEKTRRVWCHSRQGRKESRSGGMGVVDTLGAGKEVMIEIVHCGWSAGCHGGVAEDEPRKASWALIQKVLGHRAKELRLFSVRKGESSRSFK